MEGDYTRREPEISNVLNQYGRSGVPLYLYFDGRQSQPQILPQLLSVDIITTSTAS